MRIILLLSWLILSDEAISGVFPTFICLHNKTPSSHHIEVADIDNYDWEGDNRPDHNFNDLTIEPGATICRQEDVNNNSSFPHFTFVIDNNPTRMRFNISAEVESSWWGAYTNPENPTAVHGYKTFWYESARLLPGLSCYDGPYCALFDLLENHPPPSVLKALSSDR